VGALGLCLCHFATATFNSNFHRYRGIRGGLYVPDSWGIFLQECTVKNQVQILFHWFSLIGDSPMTKKRYVVHTVVISGFFMGVALLAYLLISHHQSMPNQVLQSRDGLLSNGLTVLDIIKPVGKLAIE
jgi:hypothetical protein